MVLGGWGSGKKQWMMTECAIAAVLVDIAKNRPKMAFTTARKWLNADAYIPVASETSGC
jgi:hypothetical protein